SELIILLESCPKKVLIIIIENVANISIRKAVLSLIDAIAAKFDNLFSLFFVITNKIKVAMVAPKTSPNNFTKNIEVVDSLSRRSTNRKTMFILADPKK